MASELIKGGSETVVAALTEVINTSWEAGIFPAA
jgi:hypothetical protein